MSVTLFRNLGFSFAILLTFTACGGGAGPQEECSVPGESRCSGSTVQACAADSTGRLVWREGVDCANSGQVCTASGQCTAGGGNEDGGTDADGGTNDGGTLTDGGHPPGTDGGTLPTHCGNAISDGDETDVDCGGSCAPCALGKQCKDSADCESTECGGNQTQPTCIALAPNCTDGVKNADETDVDCGGTCGTCSLDKTCSVHDDCATGVCDLTVSNTCITAQPTYAVNEDFETGNLSNFPYQLSATNENTWEIETDAAKCHGGSHCVRTSKTHQPEETSTISVSLSVRQDTQLTFWAKLNTEPDQHFFRVLVDGVEKLKLSGQVDWKQYSIPVTATGPNGPNRVLTFEYARSAFVDANHVPWNEVWVDDVDFPDWNTEPTVPKVISPWTGKLTTNRQPTFHWQSHDADFDPITFELQYDTSATFANPVTSGETNLTSYTPTAPLSDNTLYYWRVRAKDNSNFRWSAWSPTSVVEINSGYHYSAVWRQIHETQFNQNELSNISVLAGQSGVKPTTSQTSYTKSAAIVEYGGASTVTFTGLASCNGNATLTIAANGDFDALGENATIEVDGQIIGTYAPLICNGSQNFSVPCSLLSDGIATVKFTTTGAVGGGCTSSNWSSTFKYEANTGSGAMTSAPIHFSLFEGKKLWEKIQVVGTGDISVQVLDAQKQLVPDAQIPGNSTGTKARTLRLWTLDPALYPVIHLKATLGPAAVLTEWSIAANDRHEWLFGHEGDAEGWTGHDNGATPTLTVTGGLLKLASDAAGVDPNIQYTFPVPLPASRFKTLEVRVRTSNNYSNDNPTLYWQSNYGLFDARRSFTFPNVFLVTPKDVVFDLTQTPPAPNEPWQGNIEKIRIDAVERFLDQTQQPAAGWFEVESIAIY